MSKTIKIATLYCLERLLNFSQNSWEVYKKVSVFKNVNSDITLNSFYSLLFIFFAGLKLDFHTKGGHFQEEPFIVRDYSFLAFKKRRRLFEAFQY